MHQEIEDFVSKVKEIYPNNFKNCVVIEAGSCNINGSVRKFFEDCNYTGVDICPGIDVDKISTISEFFIGQYVEKDTVISCEMLEHDSTWRESLESMYDGLKRGGLLLITCAAPDRPEHGTNEHTPEDSPATTEYYRNISIEDFQSTLPPSLFSESKIEIIREGMDLLFYGIKK